MNELQPWIIPLVCSLVALGVGSICGFLAGRMYAVWSEPRRMKRNRIRTMEALTSVIERTEQLNSDVANHSNALQAAVTAIQQCESQGQFEYMRESLIQNIRTIVTSNQKMENDLVVSKYQLESAAQNLDRSRKEARTDSLCKVANRKAADETLKFLVSRYRSQKKSFGLMIIDIDHFRRINDDFGHEAGDTVLVSVGKALKECVRPEDFVGRLGEDKFVLMLEGLKDCNVELVKKRIGSTIEQYNFSVGSEGQSAAVTLSMGLAVIQDQDDPKSLFRRADEELANAKLGDQNKSQAAATPVQETAMPEPIVPAANEPQSAASYEQFKNSIENNL